jgi:hypothetical protein
MILSDINDASTHCSKPPLARGKGGPDLRVHGCSPRKQAFVVCALLEQCKSFSPRRNIEFYTPCNLSFYCYSFILSLCDCLTEEDLELTISNLGMLLFFATVSCTQSRLHGE